MENMITGKILKRRGWREGKIIGLAKKIAAQLESQGLERDEILDRLDQVKDRPHDFMIDPLMSALAKECLHRESGDAAPTAETIRSTPFPYRVWGEEHIDRESFNQMDNAMRLPISMMGALMPDAHVGYGLPIGGVLATDNVVIPYAVGVDIACRMRLSIYDVSPILIGQKRGQFERSLLDQTQFGMGAEWKGSKRAQHEVLDDAAWKATRLLASLQAAAYSQLGTSGTGNHFVEWGTFKLFEDDPKLNLKAGEYLSLLSHSG